MLRWMFTTAATVLVVAVSGTASAILPGNHRPPSANAQVDLAKAITLAALARPSGIPSFQLQETTESWPANSGIAGLAHYPGAIRSTSSWWYASPTRWRVSGRYLVPPRLIELYGWELFGGATSWPVPGSTISDGRDIWRNDLRHRLVQVKRIEPNQDSINQFPLDVGIAPFGQSFGNLPALLKRKGCYGPPTVKGSAKMSGRSVYVVDLGLALCLWGSASDPMSAGRAMIWVDKQTLFVLQYRLYDPTDPSKLLAQVRVTYVRYHASIDARLLRFVPSLGTVLDDTRPGATATVRRYNRVMGRLARRLPFPLLAPYARPAGFTWHGPRLLAHQAVQLAFVPAGTRNGLAAEQAGVAIVESRATAAGLQHHAPGARRVAAGGAAGWYSTIGRGSARVGALHELELASEGTAVVLRSRVVGRRNLVALAATLQPVAHAHAPMGIKGIPLLSALRQEVSFPIFVPTKLPPHFIPQSIAEGNGTTMPSDTVTIDYKDAESSTALELFEGPAGCCIDQDIRKYVGPLRLPNGATVYRPPLGADSGSTSVMWDQAGTFIALGGQGVGERQLLRVAASMSSAAQLRE